jgi:YbgC/YbaW family acyl-CoA thioester hydrolase
VTTERSYCVIDKSMQFSLEEEDVSDAGTPVDSWCVASSDVPRSALTHRVAMKDVDVHQIHYMTYFGWADVGMAELLAHLGHPTSSLMSDDMGLPVVASSCTYEVPLYLDDVAVVVSHFERPGRTSVSTIHEVFRQGDGARVAVVENRHVMTHRDRAVPLPGWLRGAAAREEAVRETTRSSAACDREGE